VALQTRRTGPVHRRLLPVKHLDHSVNNRTVVQFPLAASHPTLGCRAFIACNNLCYAFWVTMHL